MQTTVRNCDTNTKRVTARLLNGSSLKNTQISIGKCQYKSVTSATILIYIKLLKKHTMINDQQLLYK